MRSTVGVALAVSGTRALGEASVASGTGALGSLAVLCGCALVTGTLTPAAALLSAALCVVRGAVPTAGADGTSLALLFVMGLCVALLGPGAFSVDARLFGRREIVVPRAPGRIPRTG